MKVATFFLKFGTVNKKWSHTEDERASEFSKLGFPSKLGAPELLTLKIDFKTYSESNLHYLDWFLRLFEHFLDIVLNYV